MLLLLALSLSQVMSAFGAEPSADLSDLSIPCLQQKVAQYPTYGDPTQLRTMKDLLFALTTQGSTDEPPFVEFLRGCDCHARMVDPRGIRQRLGFIDYGLNDSEIRAVVAYTMGDYMQLNRALRGKNPEEAKRLQP